MRLSEAGAISGGCAHSLVDSTSGWEGFEDGSVDSDYAYDDSAFTGLGLELLSGKLRLAKVYGQEEPPAAEDELEWETRYFTLFDTGRICHFDDIEEGMPIGDRGLIDLANITAAEKVPGVATFVMKAESKVYMFKMEGESGDEAMTKWTDAIQDELSALTAA